MSDMNVNRSYIHFPHVDSPVRP